MSQPEPTAPDQTAAPQQRLRLTYARREALRYASHLDMHKLWERTLRRAGLPLAYSQGFHPSPRLHQASALPLGFLSRCEIIDFWLDTTTPAPPEQVAARVQAASVPGLEILRAECVPLQAPALQTQVVSAEYSAVPLDALDEDWLGQAVGALLSAAALPRERRGKPYDLRPLVEHLEVRPAKTPGGWPGLFMRLAAREGATGRPEEVLLALGLDAAAFRVERLNLILL